MGFKFRRFRAKLNWKTKAVVPEVVCVKYHTKSEFTQDLPTDVVFSLSTQTNKKKESDKPLTTKHKTTEVHTEPEQKKIKTPSENNLETNVENLPAQSRQPKSILKKTSNASPVLDEYKKSPLIYMTENHDYEEKPMDTKTKRVKPLLVTKEEPVEFRPSLNNVDNKIVNWRETIEFINSNRDSESDFKVHVESNIETKDKEDLVETNGRYFDNGVSYSTQAANIFFYSETPKPKQDSAKSSLA